MRLSPGTASGSTRKDPSMKIHPQAKHWVAVVEFIGLPIVVSVLLNVSAGPTAYWQAGVFALVCVACVLPMLFYFLEHPALFKRRISFGPGAEHETSQKIIVSFLLLLYTALYVVSGLVRHPMYSALLAMFLGLPLALGSWWGLVTFLPLLVVIIWRIVDEERYLSNHLVGYRDYCA